MLRAWLAAILLSASSSALAGQADPESFSAVAGDAPSSIAISDEQAALPPGYVYNDPSQVRYIVINRGDIFVPGAVTSPQESPMSARALRNYRFGDPSLVASSVDDTGYSLAGEELGAAAPIGAAPVPEPGEWAMIVAGLGVIGLVASRRRA